MNARLKQVGYSRHYKELKSFRFAMENRGWKPMKQWRAEMSQALKKGEWTINRLLRLKKLNPQRETFNRRVVYVNPASR